MEDRFKFRYSNNNKIYDVSAIDFTRSRGEIVSLDKMETLMCKINLDNLIQCTGLKDKNGKLIYEGDVIKIPSDHDLYGMFAGEKREVYFYEGGFRLKSKWNKNSRGNWLEDTNDFEVIGSTYENPKLLEE